LPAIYGRRLPNADPAPTRAFLGGTIRERHTDNRRTSACGCAVSAQSCARALRALCAQQGETGAAEFCGVTTSSPIRRLQLSTDVPWSVKGRFVLRERGDVAVNRELTAFCLRSVRASLYCATFSPIVGTCLASASIAPLNSLSAHEHRACPTYTEVKRWEALWSRRLGVAFRLR
jgi:hypothetical protein